MARKQVGATPSGNEDSITKSFLESGSVTLTNKRITPRVTSISSSATPTINTDNCDAVTITALSTDITSMTTNLSGTPTDFQTLRFRIMDDGTARSITWGASFEGGAADLPVLTGGNNPIRAWFTYDDIDDVWVCDKTHRVPIAISGITVSNTTSVTLPTHNTGSLIIIYAYAQGSGAPSAPSAGGTVPAWTTIDSYSNSWANYRTAYYVATASNHTSGTWTGATSMMAVVINGAKTSGPIGGHAAGANTTGSNIQAPAVTMSKTDGTSMLLHFYGAGDGVNNPTSWGSTPAGYTQRQTTTYTYNFLCLNTKNDTTSDGAITQTITHSGWQSGTSIEVLWW